jgi:hypothetical protein
MTDHSAGQISDEQLRAVKNEAMRETIARLGGDWLARDYGR